MCHLTKQADIQSVIDRDRHADRLTDYEEVISLCQPPCAGDIKTEFKSI